VCEIGTGTAYGSNFWFIRSFVWEIKMNGWIRRQTPMQNSNSVLRDTRKRIAWNVDRFKVVQDMPRRQVVLQTPKNCRVLQMVWNILTSWKLPSFAQRMRLHEMIYNLRVWEYSPYLKWPNNSRIERWQISADEIGGLKRG